MKKVLIIGGAGYFGTVLKNHLSSKGYSVVTFDLLPDTHSGPSFVHVIGDIRRKDQLERCLTSQGPFETVFHVAAELAHEMVSKKSLWETNVDGTKNIAEACVAAGVEKLVFTSTNCLWGRDVGRPITEEELPEPIEIYGQSKAAAEEILLRLKSRLHSSILRCPTIISAGRLGLLSILFNFIEENKKIYVLGSGDNRYQFIYAQDLAEACRLAASQKSTEIYNVGSDNVKSVREIYSYVINKSGSLSQIRSIPKGLAVNLLRLAHFLGVSPLGPYHYKMIAESFIFDTQKIKKVLGWRPTKTNEQMLLEAFDYYRSFKQRSPLASTGTSSHSHPASMGILRVLKWIS